MNGGQGQTSSQNTYLQLTLQTGHYLVTNGPDCASPSSIVIPPYSGAVNIYLYLGACDGSNIKTCTALPDYEYSYPVGYAADTCLSLVTSYPLASSPLTLTADIWCGDNGGDGCQGQINLK